MKKYLVPHPLLFGLLPVAFLFAQNADQMRLIDIPATAGVIVGAALAATVLLSLLMKNSGKAGLLVTVTIAIFFSYGHLLEIVIDLGDTISQFEKWPHTSLMWILGVVWLIASYRIFRSKSEFPRLTQLLNYLGVILILIQIGSAGYAIAGRSSVELTRPTITIGDIRLEEPPDIYYIILDGYGRHDVLEEIFEYDNSDALNHLRERGFFVADSAHSNYIQTLLSLTSSLNLNYLDSLGMFDRTSADRVPLANLYQTNAVFEFFRSIGYRIVTFSTGYSLSDFTDPDVNLTPVSDLSEFAALVYSTTPVPYLRGSFESRYNRERNRIRYIFSKLPRITEASSPFIAFAHIVAPHPPFMFDENGNDFQVDRAFTHGDGHHYIGSTEEYITGYRNQIRVIDSLLIKTVNGILAHHKDKPPVIIIQGDHGPGSRLHWNSLAKTYVKERLSILNAYYLPNLDSLPLYADISPINTFRIVLNSYFGTDYELLPDNAYYTVWAFPYQFQDVTDRLYLPYTPVSDSVDILLE